MTENVISVIPGIAMNINHLRNLTLEKKHMLIKEFHSPVVRQCAQFIENREKNSMKMPK